MNVVSLFAGIGGFELGLERAGMTVVAQCEISPKCRHLLRHHWPDVQQFEDVCTMRAADVPHRVHVICGGFPCQDISFAGKGAGLAGERSGLWREYARLIGEFRPDYVIVENVAALLGRGLGDVLGDLAALGYDAWWDCIPAAAVGAPHRRDRLWIVAYPGGIEHQGFGDALRREIAAGLSRAAAEQGVLAGNDDQADALNPDADSLGSHRPGIDIVGDAELRDEQIGDAEPMGGHVSHPDRQPDEQQPRGVPASERPGSGWSDHGPGGMGEGLPDPTRDGRVQDDFNVQGEACGRASAGQSAGGSATVGGQWSTEPDVGRVAHGVPARVDRLHGLGNAVVPLIPEVIGRAIIAAEMSLAANDSTDRDRAA